MIPNQSENITSSQGRAEDFVSRFEEDGFNIQRLLGGIISFWPFYLVSVVLFLSGAYLINRYADRIYGEPLFSTSKQKVARQGRVWRR